MECQTEGKESPFSLFCDKILLYMRIGVFSDSHGDIRNLERGARYLLDSYQVEMFIHLGDDYSDALSLEKFGLRVLRVPGVFSGYYQDPHIPNRIVEILSGYRVLLSHTLSSHRNDLPQDLKPEDLIKNKEVDIVLFGHTHVPFLEEREGILYLNPGHVKEGMDKGYPPTFAFLRLEKEVQARVIDLKGKVLLEGTYLLKPSSQSP